MLTRDQTLARFAHECVEAISPEIADDYRIMANDLGATILQCGLCTAIAYLQRRIIKGHGMHKKHDMRQHIVQALATARIPSITKKTKGDDLYRVVQSLPVDAYVMATRETLRFACWLRRAVQVAPTGQTGEQDA